MIWDTCGSRVMTVNGFKLQKVMYFDDPDLSRFQIYKTLIHFDAWDLS